MSDSYTKPVPPQEKAPPGRLRRFFTRHLPLGAGGAALLAVAALIVLYLWARTPQCERLVRRWLVAQAESATGGRVEIGTFTWRPLELEADAGGIVIHGREAAGETPYAQIRDLRVGLSVLGFFSPRVLLHDVEVSQPTLHLIVYADGSTNQPQLRRTMPHKPALETLFNLKAGRVTVNDAVIDFEDRATGFDFQNRDAPLNLKADDLSLVMGYVHATKGAQEHYRIEAGARNLDLRRGARPSPADSAKGQIQAVFDLTRTSLYVRSLEITSDRGKQPNARLEIAGALDNFAHPRWHGTANGDVDLGLLDPTTGYPFAPKGLAHVNLSGAGSGAEFHTDGSVAVENGTYDGPGVNATGVHLNAQVHADPRQLLITNIVARLRQSGEIDGTVALQHWLPPAPGAVVEAVHPAKSGEKQKAVAIKTEPVTIPVDGRVTAQLKGVSLDTILGIVSQAPYQRLGFDALVSGPATATWFHGETQSIVVSARLDLGPGGRLDPGEVAANGVVDATYMQCDGSVNLRNLEFDTAGNHLHASGRIGAYPIRSPSAINVDFESRNLKEFDTLLRSLGLHHNDKSGVAAIPVSMGGEATFQGNWTGSLADPHLAGQLEATQLALEMPAAAKGTPTEPRLVRFDSVDATGSYSATQIVIRHALLVDGASRVTVSGSLQAAPGTHAGFGGDSSLRAELQVEHVSADQLQPFVSTRLPVTGTLDAQLAVSGDLNSPGGSGSVEATGGALYGEPIHQARVQGTLVGRVLKIANFHVNAPAGEISGSGSYDLASRRFQIATGGSGLDISRVSWLKRQGLDTAGRLKLSISGSGALGDPQLRGEATFTSLALNGEPLGGIHLTAHTEGHALVFTGTSQIEGADLSLRGQTTLKDPYATSASLTFAKFNVAALMKMAQVEGLTADSSLAGAITIEGPLSHLALMHGDARLRELAVTLAGVHLRSEGGLHARLANNRVTLDPLHIAGEDTDLRVQGGLDLEGARHLDLSGQGSVNLKLAETLDPDLTAAGTATFQIEAHGPVKSPNLQGRIDFQDCSLSLGDLPNGLSQLHGTLAFNQNRLEVKTLTALTGGGLLSLGGYLAYQHGIFADLTATGNGIRIRYPQGLSSLADASLHLVGPQNNLLLAGNVLITRFTVSPDLDVATLAAQANAAVEKVAPPEAPSNHVRLDLHIVSSPQLNFQNAYAKLAGDVDLRLRGTMANPSLLGRVSITEGAATIAGTRYELERGEITFTNPVRIEPNLDLTASARVSDYDITLDVHGTPAHMTVNPRSDPPLPEADVISLLALGHTQNQERLYTAQQEQSLTNPTTDALLGGALNATVSSRIQKLFGAGSVKIDPHYLGALGNSTSRITVQEQFGRNVTFTYATDVDTTGQQLLQAEIAINRHVSVLVARDESGVFSMVIKATRRYR
jgi:translocation and assembly module TamB